MSPREALAAADVLRAGNLIEAVLATPEEARLFLEELTGILGARFDAATPSWSQFLVGPDRVLFNWSVGNDDHVESLDLRGFPFLSRVVANAVALSDALRGPEERLLLSIVPSLYRDRTWPRFYHRDSHSSVDEVESEMDSLDAYRMVWDIGLGNSCDVLNVNFISRRAVLDATGAVSGEYRHLFQRQNIEFRTMTEEEIDQVQLQMREEMLPFPETARDLREGVAFIWLDDRFFHSVYLKHGRSTDELRARPRSILVLREFCANSQDRIEFSEPIREGLGLTMTESEP